MILLVDIGNSRMKWAWLVDGVVQDSQAVDCEDLTPAKLANKAWEKLEGIPERVMIASVAAAKLNKGIVAWMSRHWKVKADMVKSQAEFSGVQNAYLEPALLGVDRWSTLLAARSITGGAACIIDCGSAITIDVLSACGEHLGGLIAPGLTTMTRCLVDKTEAIAAMKESSGEVSLLARDTYAAVHVGSLYAVVALIDRVISDLRLELRGGFRIFITGGEAKKLMPLLDDRSTFEPDLVLKGLACILAEEKNQK
ncbi:MAG: type III pantothenate kinase [Gammaproteobacteria bacterium]|nr:type III pantothenate kinase [Gammaproteobacteria bacterium]